MSIKKSLPLIGSIFTFLLLSVFVFNGCESSRVGPEIARPNPPAPVAQPILLTAYVRDQSLAGIAGVTVKISKADNSVVATVLTDNSGKYSYDVTSLTETALIVAANKDGYSYGSKIAEIKKALNIALVDDIVLSKLVVASAPVTPAAGGTATTPNTQSLSAAPLAVSVPPNAVASNITLTVANIPAAEAPKPTAAGTSIIAAAEFGPSGTVFAVPVTVSIPLPTRLAAGSTFELQKLNETTQVWAATGVTATVDATGLVATAKLSSFSKYAGMQNTVITIPATGTTTTADLATVTLASGVDNKVYSETSGLTLTITSGSNNVESNWLRNEVRRQAGGFYIGTLSKPLHFSIPALPANYLNNGVQYNPAKPNEAGTWSYRWYIVKSTTVKNYTATGGVAPNTWAASGSLTEEEVSIDVARTGWVWIAHNQGGTL